MVATWLASAGYTTGLVGKYLNGYGRNNTSFPSDNPTCVPPGWTDWQALTEPTIGRVYDYELNDNGVLIDYGSAPADYQTDVLASRAVDFLTGLPGAEGGIDVPFFLWIATPVPHQETIGGALLASGSNAGDRPPRSHQLSTCAGQRCRDLETF